MSISSLIPIREREEALLDELRKEGKPLKTGILVERVFHKFPHKLTHYRTRKKNPFGIPLVARLFQARPESLEEKG